MTSLVFLVEFLMTEPSKPTYIPRLYGRRQDKALKPRQQHLMTTLLPQLSVPLTFENKAPNVAIAPVISLDPKNFMRPHKELWLEVGFGGGEHLAWQARENPDIAMIGAEPFLNGVAKLLAQIDDEGQENIHIHHGDVRPLLTALPDQCLGRLFVLHPDPWPKKRHHKRRMINPWFVAEAARLLKPGGQLRVASDIAAYVEWTLMHLADCPDFFWTAKRADDWRVRPDDWPQTRYEVKAIREGRPSTYLIFERSLN